MNGNFHIVSHTGMETLAGIFIKDILEKDNYRPNPGKGGFLSGGNVIICESRGLAQYIQKKCADTGEQKIWTALPFKPLVGLLMQYAYNLFPREQKKDESENVFSENNLVWSIYRLLSGREKTFSFAREIASLFGTYQIYRPELIEAWNRGEAYSLPEAGGSFRNNEQWQRELWRNIKSGHKDEQDIAQLYRFMQRELQNAKSDTLPLPRRIFLFAPMAIAPVHLSVLTLLAQAGCAVNVYLPVLSGEYADFAPGPGIAALRTKSWNGDKTADETHLYWDLGNALIANLGRAAQTLYEQIAGCAGVVVESAGTAPGGDHREKSNTLLEKLQSDIRRDSNKASHTEKDGSIVFNNCFSPLREIEALCDYVLDLFASRDLGPADIAVVSPNIEKYADAVESVFGRNNIPYRIADRDIKKYDKTAQLLHLLFAQAGGRYEAADITALFEYSLFVQDISLDPGERDVLEKWIGENAVRYGIESPAPLPNYSFAGGFEQLASGFFMIAENGFSDAGGYCYPDIEGSAAHILGDFACFVEALHTFEREIKEEKTIEAWDYFFRENLQVFFGSDETDFNEEIDNPFQKVIGAWDALKKEMLTGFGGDTEKIDFLVIKNALPQKLEANAKASYSLTGRVSFSTIETLRAVPYKVLCCIGMNGGEFPRQTRRREIDLLAEYRLGDKDTANEDRLMFLETICAAGETLYVSWTGQSEKNAEEIEPSGAVVMLLKNIEKQYGIKPDEIVVKHPLQPFSKKYFNGTLSTYDNRWTPGNSEERRGGGDIWQWEITHEEDDDPEERPNIEALYRILSDAPKYFLRDVCHIQLPEPLMQLENTEPFVVEKGLEEWKLADLILRHDDYHHEIRIEQLRGGLPNGVFADKAIDLTVKETEELKESAKGEAPGTFWIYPGKDKGKYRLKHWLYHLDLNLKTENQDTKLFLKDKVIISLQGMPKEKAAALLAQLWDLADGLKRRMLPLFPNAAWEYLSNTGNGKREFSREERLAKAWENMSLYSQYARMAIGDAESFADLAAGAGIEDAFIACSEALFENYNGVNIA